MTNTFTKILRKASCYSLPVVWHLLFAIVCSVPAIGQHAPATDIVHIEGFVRDAATSLPIPYANLVVDGGPYGTASNENGVFHLMLTPGLHTVVVSAIGYSSYHLRWDVKATGEETREISLQPAVVYMDEVMVDAQSSATNDLAAPQQKLNATEDLMQRVAGVELIQRANFAWEPALRGLSGGQVGLVIDGMKIYGACVDKMDPASSYVEPENLEKLEVSKGGFDLTKASQIGGSVNLVTEKPDFTQPYDLDLETGFESVAALRRVRVGGGASIGRFAFRGSASYRKANDFSPGGHDAIAYSGFEKRNYKMSLAARLSNHQQLTFSFLGDDAWNIGYPVLLMDASLAQARIFSLVHAIEPVAPWLHKVETRLYHNRVDHWMDDRNRDVMQREVMRGMYMPMYGFTETVGGIIKTNAHVAGNQFELTLDAHQVKQFGDMWMFSLFPNIQDMYLLNMGDIAALNTAATLDYQRPISSRLKLRTNARIDLSWRDVQREEMVSIFASRFGIDNLKRTYELFSGSASLEYVLRPTTLLRLSLAHTERLPTNAENYGHYVYNYVDGYFYTGNPDLASEKSRQVELSLEHFSNRFGVRITGFYNQLSDYIIGISDSAIDVGLGGRTSVYRFRIYDNTDKAYLYGSEVSLLLDLMPGLEAAASISYAKGHNLSLDDPLPMIPPLNGFFSLRSRGDKHWSELESRWAFPQNRNSKTADEDVTDGYNILNLRAGYSINAQMELKAGVENILDTFYHEHLSIGNLPGRGRNVFVSLTYSL